jgi:hypothetical protein
VELKHNVRQVFGAVCCYRFLVRCKYSIYFRHTILVSACSWGSFIIGSSGRCCFFARALRSVVAIARNGFGIRLDANLPMTHSTGMLAAYVYRKVSGKQVVASVLHFVWFAVYYRVSAACYWAKVSTRGRS